MKGCCHHDARTSCAADYVIVRHTHIHRDAGIFSAAAFDDAMLASRDY